MAYDLDTFLSIPRAAGVVLSPDGRRAVTTVSVVAPDGKKMRSALWEVDPVGSAPPRQLTRSTAGESEPVFTPDGDLLFASTRPDPNQPTGDDDGPARTTLWRLPVEGGEAYPVAEAPGGIGTICVARNTGRIAMAIGVLPSAPTLDQDRETNEARRDAGVTAQLFDHYPIRFWDHYLGPRHTRIFVADPADDGGFGPLRPVATTTPYQVEVAFDLSPDGTTLYLSEKRTAAAGDLSHDVVAVDVGTGRRTRLTEETNQFYNELTASPDGRHLACVREVFGSPQEPFDVGVWLIDLDTGDGRDITAGLDRFPRELAWSHDSKQVFFVADDAGHAPLYSVTVTKRPQITRHTSHASFDSPQPHPDGTCVVAIRSHVDHPATAVRVSLASDAPAGDTAADDDDGRVVVIPTPGGTKVPGRVRNVTATGVDGTPLRSWLVLPTGTSRNNPAPLVVWVHGGPVASWNNWSWRWNPWLLAARGYAVLLPDPALSTGYGREHLQRGWGRWGDAPYTDVLAATDAACARPDIDADRTALMGGSFGGYMANWVAGHTDRFDCIVTHASLWALPGFHGTTDIGTFWEAEFGDPYVDPSTYHEWSPHRFVGEISTPMLVIHGELDHRVPISEALRLWTDLRRNDVESKFLYFPDENHWILKPQNARIWYETVFAWLDHHVLGQDWTQPELL